MVVLDVNTAKAHIMHVFIMAQPYYSLPCTHNVLEALTLTLESNFYIVQEKDRFLQVCVKLIEGGFRREVSLTLTVTEDSAGINNY